MSLQTTKINALHIPVNDYPSFLYDTYNRLKEYVFKDDRTYSLEVGSSFYFLLSYFDFANVKRENTYATHIYRVYQAREPHEVIYGDALLIGTDYSSLPLSLQETFSHILNTK